jgi:hypothetical protein
MLGTDEVSGYVMVGWYYYLLMVQLRSLNMCMMSLYSKSSLILFVVLFSLFLRGGFPLLHAC